jgi:hypothetical protein
MSRVKKRKHKLTRDDAKDPFDKVALSPVVAETAVVLKRVTSFTIQPEIAG